MCESSLHTIYILAGANYGSRDGGFATKQSVGISVVVGEVKMYHSLKCCLLPQMYIFGSSDTYYHEVLHDLLTSVESRIPQ